MKDAALRIAEALAAPQGEAPNMAVAHCLLSAAAKSGDKGAIELAAQLAGVPPCKDCGYVIQHCRCDKAAPLGEPVLQDIEQYRLQMAGICTAAIGYWKEGDGIHPDYDTLALHDVAKLYAKYDDLYQKAHPAPAPLMTDGEICTAYIEATNQTLRQQDEHLALKFARVVERHVRGVSNEDA